MRYIPGIGFVLLLAAVAACAHWRFNGNPPVTERAGVGGTNPTSTDESRPAVPPAPRFDPSHADASPVVSTDSTRVGNPIIPPTKH